MMTAIHKHIDFEVPAWGEFAAGPQLKRGWVSAVNNLNPQRWWRLGESSGTVASDAQGLSHGTYLPNSGGVWTGGALGVADALAFDSDTAADFTAFTGYVDTGYTPPTGASVRSIVFWFNPDTIPTAIGSQNPFGYGLNTNGRAMQMNMQSISGTDYMLFQHVGGNIRFPGVAANVWQMIAMVVPTGATTTDDVLVYVNGVLQTGTRNAGSNQTLDTGSSTLYIGANFLAAAKVDGKIDEFVLFATDLTNQNLLDLYNAGVGQ